jgi:hypothetical protein
VRLREGDAIDRHSAVADAPDFELVAILGEPTAAEMIGSGGSLGLAARTAGEASV